MKECDAQTYVAVCTNAVVICGKVIREKLMTSWCGSEMFSYLINHVKYDIAFV